MDIRDLAFAPLNAGPLGGRQHRFMESADINAAFRELFIPLRANVRRGLSNEGQVYGLEMDSHVPGELLGTEWIPIVSRGIDDTGALADPAARRDLFDRLLRETRPEALFAYICERGPEHGPSVLYLEIVSADASYAAEYPICAGEGWHVRDLLKAAHRKLDPVTLD
ncbi:MAG: hypothetical protein ACOZJX_21635 [Pseudomonadota bacterium]